MDNEAFLNDLSQKLRTLYYDTSSIALDKLVNIFIQLLDYHAPIKRKRVRGNQNRFMNKDLSKAIMKRSQLKSKYLKNKTPLNRLNYKKQRNLCVKLRDKAIKADFSKSFSNIRTNSKPFYDIMKPYLTNKGALCASDISLMENGNIITDDKDISNIFVEYYTNIVKYSSGESPEIIADTLAPGTNVDTIIESIIFHYANHPSIQSIHQNINLTNTFKFRLVTEKEVLELLSFRTFKVYEPQKGHRY